MHPIFEKDFGQLEVFQFKTTKDSLFEVLVVWQANLSSRGSLLVKGVGFFLFGIMGRRERKKCEA